MKKDQSVESGSASPSSLPEGRRARKSGPKLYGISNEKPRVLEDPKIKEVSWRTRARYANIMYDSAFKLVFGSKANKALLIQLLEALIPGAKIADVTFQDKEIPGFFVGDKKTVFDLFCTTDRAETFIVEMQLHTQHYFTDRVLFYSTYPIREQIVTPTEDARIQMLKDFGEEDWSRVVHRKTSYRLRPVYMVCILNFELPHVAEAELREDLVSSYSVRSDDGSGEKMTDALHFVFLELPRLRVDRDHPETCRTMLERIAFAFRHISFLQDRPESFAGEFFVHLFHAAELAGMNLDERNQYDIEMTTEIDKIAQLDYAHGQGVEEGRKEERWRIAYQMLHAGIDGDVIARLTTLSADEVRALG